MHNFCGRSHYELHKNRKTKYTKSLVYQSNIPVLEELTNTELYSSYLGKVPIKAKIVGENIYLESIYLSNKNKKIFIKILDQNENKLSDQYLYPVQELLRLKSVTINKNENLYNYLITLYCYLRINQIEQIDENIIKYRELINEINTKELENRIRKEHPSLLNETIFMPLRLIKKILQNVTLYNSRVDILFGALEYLSFINGISDGELETINNQDILIFISGVPNLDNAYWNGSYMVFGNGKQYFYPLTSIDVIGHELTHGLIQGINNLEYKGHSGALNESYADIFGVMLEFYVYEKYKDKLLGKKDWMIGEDLTIDDKCLRSMKDPHSCKQPSKMFDEYYIDPLSMIDYGGVHTNSGIPNHCFYLISQKINKYETLRIFIKCLHKLFIKSSFYTFKRVLHECSNDEAIRQSLLIVGLPIYSNIDEENLDESISFETIKKEKADNIDTDEPDFKFDNIFENSYVPTSLNAKNSSTKEKKVESLNKNALYPYIKIRIKSKNIKFVNRYVPY